MASVGKTEKLKVLKTVDFGLFLDGGDLGEILLPLRYVPDDCYEGDWIDVFIYLDSEDRIIATTETPHAEIGQCACMTVVDTNSFGAFLDWGLTKDLLVPFKEQQTTMRKGHSYMVTVFEDKTGRICGSSKFGRFFKETAEGHFKPGQAVELLIVSRSDIGYKAIIDGTHLGIIHNADALVPLEIAQKIAGYIKLIRPDDAIDLSLQKRGEEMRYSLTKHILEDLAQNGGTSALTDKSAAEDIFHRYKVSKGNYKKALGQLYKEKKIVIDADKITLSPAEKE